MKKIFLLAISWGILLLLTPSPVQAASISPIGDLAIGEKKEITVSGLDPKTEYGWVESRLVARRPVEYREVYSQCFISNDQGKFRDTIGPIGTTGEYLLKIYQPFRSGECSKGAPIIEQKFTVGGATGQECCVWDFLIYDRDRDVCKKDLINPEPNRPTECSKTNTFCEPQSLKCFKTKTWSGPIFQPTKCKVGTPQEGIETALGCIPTKNTTGFIAWILKFAIGIGGGIAFILMLIGAFQIITSAGDPERLKAGKELITSALIGLLMIIFSLFLLKLIGVDILQIPGFGPQNPGGGGGGTGKNLLM